MSVRQRLTSLLAAAVLAVTALAVGAAPAHAAPPNTDGFALWNGSAVVAGTAWPAGTTVTPGGTGVYTVRFPGIAVSGGVVHVVAVNQGPVWCQVIGWGPSTPDEIAQVRCFAVPGIPVNTGFSVFFTSDVAPPGSTPGAYGYVYGDTTGALLTSYNSAGAPNTIAPGGAGAATIVLNGLPTPAPQAGSVQVTAVGSAAARCALVSWNSAGSQQIKIQCVNGTGAPITSRFTLTYQYQVALNGFLNPPARAGYLWWVPGVGPAPTNFNSLLGPVNTATSAPQTLVTFPQLASTPDNIQATAFGPAGQFCNLLMGWVHSGPDTIMRDVDCYNAAGVLTPTGFTISDNSVL
jgi:hypothetical protein